MKDEIIIPKMQELAKMINYEPKDISFLQKAMYCQKVHKVGDGRNRDNYTNDSYATLGDSILKFVLTDYLFDKDYDKAEITQVKQKFEANTTLFGLCNKIGIFRYAYNDAYFSPDAPEHNQVYH